MSVLQQIRTNGVFRSPMFADLSEEHVPFDELTGRKDVEKPLLDAIAYGSSSFVVGPRGAGKSSILAWTADHLPDKHFAIRVPVIGMDEPTDPGVFASVAMGAALEAARVGDLSLQPHQTAALQSARADEQKQLRTPGAKGGKVGGGPVPAEVSAQLASLQTEHSRGALRADRMWGLEQLLEILNYQGYTPVFMVEDTEAAIGSGTPDAEVAKFFSASLRMLVRELDAPSLIAVQDQFEANSGYAELLPHVLKIAIPRLKDRTDEGLRRIISHRLAHFEIPGQLDELLDPASIPHLTAFYDQKDGSIRYVLQALEAAAAAALEDPHAQRLEVSHVRKGIEDWRTR